MVVFGVYLFFITAATGLVLIKPTAVASVVVILQFFTVAALTTPEEPEEQIEIVEEVDAR